MINKSNFNVFYSQTLGLVPVLTVRKMMPNHDSSRWAVPVLVFALTLVAFLPLLDNGFVDWDDPQNFASNPFFQGLGWPQIRWAFSTLHMGAYQPFSWLLFSAEYIVWGLDPGGYHLMSVFLHASNSMLLCVLTIKLVARCAPEAYRCEHWLFRVAAGAGTALYMVHPLRVEVVAWASCQPYLPCAAFTMLAILAYLRANPYGGKRSTRWLLCSWLLFATALMFKAVAISLPALLLILDVYPLRRIGPGPRYLITRGAKRAYLEKLPFLLLALLLAAAAVMAKEEAHVLELVRSDGFGARLAKACYAASFYPMKTFLPLRLRPHYDWPSPITWSNSTVLSSVCLVAAVSFSALTLRRRYPGVLTAWLAYLAVLAPNSGFIGVGDHAAADRYSYLAMISGNILLAYTLGKALERARTAVGVILVVLAVFLTLASLTFRQCSVWHDPSTLVDIMRN
jgi:protein O-mannosyl-transferase